MQLIRVQGRVVLVESARRRVAQLSRTVSQWGFATPVVLLRERAALREALQRVT